eukprot:3580775-Amphidinium_carterae.2
MFILGDLRPSKVKGPTAASRHWHLHRDPIFALTSAFYHQSMAPSYGRTSTSTPGQPANGEASAEGQPATADTNYIKWVLVNLIINQKTLDSMDDGQAPSDHMEQHHWYPSKYNKRYTNYSIELIIDPSETSETINISDFIKCQTSVISSNVKKSTMSSCLGPSLDKWLANHLVDYSISSSSSSSIY